MTKTHSDLLEKIYADLLKKDVTSFLSHFDEKMTFQVPGKSVLAGKYTKANYAQNFRAKLDEISKDTYQIEVHDILASDRHGTVLVTESLKRGAETLQIRAVHVWRFENDRAVAWYEYPRDLYQYDAAWTPLL